jgi:hypothetical protein
MYASKTISRKLLSAGLFRTAYGMGEFHGDEEVVYELFVFCAVLLECKGWDIDALLSGIDANDYRRASLITNFVDSLDDHNVTRTPDCLRLMGGLHELLRMQFSDTEHLARRQFLEDLTALSCAS